MNDIITITVNDGKTVTTYVGDFGYVLKNALIAARNGYGFSVVYRNDSVVFKYDFVADVLISVTKKDNDYAAN